MKAIVRFARREIYSPRSESQTKHWFAWLQSLRLITLLAIVWMPHANARNMVVEFLLTTPASKMEVGLVRMNIWLLRHGQNETSAKLEGERIVISHNRIVDEVVVDDDVKGTLYDAAAIKAKAACKKWVADTQGNLPLFSSFFGLPNPDMILLNIDDYEFRSLAKQ